MNDFQILRILKGFDEDYEIDESSFLVERNMIPKLKTENLNMFNLNSILEQDDGSNWDYVARDSMDECIEVSVVLHVACTT